MLRSATHASLRSASDSDLAACASGPCQLIVRVARPVPPELAKSLRAFPGVLDCTYLPHDSFAIVASQVRYRGTLLIRISAPVGPYSRTMPRALW